MEPPFNAVRAAFWLIAGVLAVQCMIALATTGACIWWSGAIVEGHFSCGPAADRVAELLIGALAAALAFGSGQRGK